MQKQAPSIGRILVAAGFTLSCFGLILFLWIAFGGPTPLKPKSYRITANFPEATQLAVESDVRIGGVSVGKVKEIGLAPDDERVEGYDTTEAVMEIKPEFAPISSDARAILRQKTLLGETYVELTSGTEPGDEAAPVSLGAAGNATDAQAEEIESIEEGGNLAVSQTRNATQIDEIFNALDTETRQSFQRWQQNVAVAINGRGQDVNDALGNLGPFVTDASRVLAVLNGQKVALKGLVRDTGTVFEALSERDQELAGAIVGSEQTFGALADSDEALAESFQILPTFQRETRTTLEALDDFQVIARPLVQKLLPVANDISPTLRSVRQLSPNLENLFRDLDPLIKAGRRGYPGAGAVPRAGGAAAGARRARAVPGQREPGADLSQDLQEDRRGLPGGARLRALEHAARAARPADRPHLPEAARLPQLRGALVLADTTSHQPRERLSGAGLPVEFDGGLDRHLRQLRLQEHRLHAHPRRGHRRGRGGLPGAA